MPDCDYCEASFDSENAYLDHLSTEHEGELSAIDQRRVADHEGSSGRDISWGPIILVALLALAGAVVVYITFLMGGQSGKAFSDSVQQPENLRSVHMHGPMNVTIDGRELDFSRRKFQVQAQAFHFEAGNGERYHVHAQQVTLEFALESLNIGVRETMLSYQGTTYKVSEGDTVRYLVNGEPVNPETYVLQDGDAVTVVAEKGSSNSGQ